VRRFITSINKVNNIKIYLNMKVSEKGHSVTIKDTQGDFSFFDEAYAPV
jgi:hypothetical protein